LYIYLLSFSRSLYNTKSFNEGKKMATGIGKKVSFYLLSLAGVLLFIGSCRESGVSTSSVPSNSNEQSSPAETAPQEDPNAMKMNWSHPRSNERLEERREMVNTIKRYYNLNNKKVLDAMLNVPRHWFVPQRQQHAAYANRPLEIGHGQTISQPFVVAYMTSLLEPDPNDVVLEVGTGSGYQAAVLSEFTPHVYSIEILEPLAKEAKARLRERGYNTIQVKAGDGYKGWPEHTPFDAIIVTCAPEHIPSPLLQQLAPDGKIVIPVGGQYRVQELMLVTKDTEGKITKKSMMPVRFVPLTREKP
jgi:protein-L-isoaspartate(D-aspartate) O-methyltransferase